MTKIALSRRHQLADLVVLVSLAGLILWYFFDALRASSHITNLILIAPVTGIVLLLCVIDFVRTALLNQAEGNEQKADPVANVVPVIVIFVVYVAALPWLGFDVGTILFVASFLWIHGERRLAWVLGYSVSFASLTALFFASMLPYPMPMLILPS